MSHSPDQLHHHRLDSWSYRSASRTRAGVATRGRVAGSTNADRGWCTSVGRSRTATGWRGSRSACSEYSGDQDLVEQGPPPRQGGFHPSGTMDCRPPRWQRGVGRLGGWCRRVSPGALSEGETRVHRTGATDRPGVPQPGLPRRDHRGAGAAAAERHRAGDRLARGLQGRRRRGRGRAPEQPHGATRRWSSAAWSAR